MYTSPDEDRSDLFLAAAVYVLGPEVLDIVLRRVPIPAEAVPVVNLFVVLTTTVLVPFLLIRYRKERLRDFGADRSFVAVTTGLIASLFVGVAFVLGDVISGAPLLTSVPVANVAAGGVFTVTSFVLRVVSGLCVVLLAIYVTVKARTAFRADARYLGPTVIWLARIAGIVAAGAAALLFLTVALRNQPAAGLLYLVVPLGVAGAVWFVHRSLSGSVLTARATLVTPMVILAIGSLVLFGEAARFVVGLWEGAMLAGIGLCIGALLESRRTAWAPLGLGLGLVLLTPLL